MKVLITGGAGFIGGHLGLALAQAGHEVTILDSFSSQVHGLNPRLLPDLEERAQILRGSVTDPQVLNTALDGQEAVVHFAAETGTGQSMYDVARYAHVNIDGTAQILDYLVNHRNKHKIQRLVVASSRAIYGEGRYQCSAHGVVYPQMRTAEQMSHGQWDPLCPICHAQCRPLPTGEESDLHCSSFYGLTKKFQEEAFLLFGRTLGIPTFALRYQNVYGPGQSLCNPYTGILAIFSGLARSGQRIILFEDGLPSRDFVYIEDVVAATVRCLDPDLQGVAAINVGSGEAVTIEQVAKTVVEYFNSASPVSVSGAYRVGDIRFNVADLTRCKQLLGFTPRWTFAEGVKRFLDWASAQAVESGDYSRSLEESKARGLMHGGK